VYENTIIKHENTIIKHIEDMLINQRKKVIYSCLYKLLINAL